MRNSFTLRYATLASLLITCSSPTLAAGSAAAGATVFEEECAECHTVTGKNKKGPSLKGVIGRKAGTAAGYLDYSDAVKSSNLVWTVDAVDKYLTKPKQFSPTIKMKFDGLANANDRANLIEFLASKK